MYPQYWMTDDLIMAEEVVPKDPSSYPKRPLPDVSDCPEEGCLCPNPNGALLRVGMGYEYDKSNPLSGELSGKYERDALRVSAREGNGALHLYAPQVCSEDYDAVAPEFLSYMPRERLGDACGDVNTAAGRNMVNLQKLLNNILNRIEALEDP